jgi:hypothetical protein
LEQDTIRARTIELINDRGEPALVLDGGGGDREPGLVVYGSGGPESAVAIVVRRDDGMPMVMATSAAGTAMQLTFDPDGASVINVRDTDGSDRRVFP